VSRAQEVALARTAAPSVIAERAGIWVLGERGYEKAVESSIGYGCIVQRGTNGQSLIPRCDEASGVDALYPLFFLLEELRAQGKTVAEYSAAVGDGYRTWAAPRVHAHRQPSSRIVCPVFYCCWKNPAGRR
jgi:hypothetical protein